MKKKILCLILIITLSIFSLSGCYDAIQIETLAYAVAIGIDEGSENVLNLSLQIALNTSSNSEGNASSQSSDSTVISVECSSIQSGINLINSYISKQINLSHCKVIVISEILAYKGISEYLYTLINNIQLRPDCNLVISKCKASDFLEHSKPTLEQLSARYYETIVATAKHTGFSDNIHLFEFFNDHRDEWIQASTILAGVNTSNTQIKSNGNNFFDADTSYTASQTPIKSENNIEYKGLAVFSEDKLVGELNSIETICHLMVTNRLKDCVLSIPNPLKDDSSITLFVSKRKNTENSVYLVNNSPYIKTNIFLKANILSMDSGEDFSSSEDLLQVEKTLNNYIEENVLSYLYKTSKELNSDIVGFGRHVAKNYLTIQEANNSKWLQNYKNSFFSCIVDCNVESSYALLKT